MSLQNKKLPIYSVWEGIYKSFAEAGGDLDVFETDMWIDKQKEKILEEINNQENSILTESEISKDYPLAVVVAMILGQLDTISVLDFGGGMGLQFLELLRKVSQTESIKYYIVDNHKITSQVPKQIKVYKNLSFHNTLGELGQRKMDVLHIGSALQYIENWTEFLEKLNKQFNPDYFVFSDLLAGNVRTFVTHQIYYGKRIPHLFINIDEFLNYMLHNLHTKLLFKSKFIRKILNQESIFPNYGLPDKYRIDRPYSLVFKKS